MTDHSKTRLRVVGDGTMAGTHVETEHGQEIKGVTGVSWSMAGKGARSTVVFEVSDCEIDIETRREP